MPNSPRMEGAAMDARWKYLETHSDREEIQAEIRKEIRKGTIRVVPGPRGIRIVPQVWESERERQAVKNSLTTGGRDQPTNASADCMHAL